MPKILVINGPNLNLLGKREPGVYGSESLADIEQALTRQAGDQGVDLACYQSNDEGALVNRIQACADDGTDFIIINPAAYTHTSVALRDALLAVALPFVEVHLSNVHARETFRRNSFLSDVALGVITGFGSQGYHFALSAALRHLGISKG